VLVLVVVVVIIFVVRSQEREVEKLKTLATHRYRTCSGSSLCVVFSGGSWTLIVWLLQQKTRFQKKTADR
jgi:hypothetical protein